MATKARGRQPGFVMSDAHRVKIQNSNILNALVEHVEGKRDMSSTQVSAGIALLKKVMPGLAQTDITSGGGKIDFPSQIILTAARDNRED
jgi:hypothetical protein